MSLQGFTPKRIGIGTSVLLLLAVVLAAALWGGRRTAPAIATPQLPASPGEGATYVENARCGECHADSMAEWTGSHHDLAMQSATAETVLGDFNNATFTAYGVTTRFFKEDDRFMVNTQGSDGAYADFRVDYTFGVEPLQQYLLAFPNGRYQALTVAWDTQEKRWFHLYPAEEITPDDPLHWTRRHFAWNSACAECHSTDLKLNYDLESDSYSTSWAEMNVSCQACHGPGSAHVAWAAAAAPEGADPQLVVDYRGMSAAEQVETCAGCHSRRYPISQDDGHGGAYLDNFMPELLREGLYHADGQILDEVYVYGSFLQSKMYGAGVKCTQCHNPHTLKLRQPGNALCTACHQPNPPTAAYPGLQAKAYDATEHHFHEPDSTGAQCVSCHMPAQDYMVVDPRRDHSLRIPRPDLSVQWGTPNACTQCHTEQQAQWAVDVMNGWYGDGWQRPHYGEALAGGRLGVPGAVDSLSQWADDPQIPVIVRATALDLLRSYGEPGLESLRSALNADAPLLRAVAVQGMGPLPDGEKLALLAPRLADPVRAVRIEAARELALLPQAVWDTASTEQRSAFDSALAEYIAAQRSQPDQPEGHANLGRLYTVLGDLKAAETAYQTAISRDPDFFQAHNNLANLYYQQGRVEEAEVILRQGIAASPEAGVLHYSMALLLAEQQRTDEALHSFARAASLLAQNPRVQYNYGLILQQVGRYTESLTALQRAYELVPYDPEILYALINFHMSAGEWAEALPYAEELIARYPDVPEFQGLAASLRGRQ